MEIREKSFRVGVAAVGCALLLRLISGNALGVAMQMIAQPQVSAALVFLKTGRVVKVPQPELYIPQETLPEAVPPETVPAWQEEIRAQAVFSPQDAELIEVLNFSGYEPDITDLLQKPLSWELTGEGPTVLILHTHATEGYKDTEGYRSEDTLCNMVSVGQRLAELLEEAGVGVIHDTMLHDQPSYSGAYEHARSAVQEYLARYPTIRLVLDLHRDAIADGNGTQLAYTLQTPKGNAARMMLVMGSGSGGLSYPNWQENLSLAVKLQAQLEKTTPGICRPIGLRASRYNQDLSPGALLIEMGAAGNTRQEALLSAEFLADAIIDLAYGAKGMQNAYMHSLQ